MKLGECATKSKARTYGPRFLALRHFLLVNYAKQEL
jgi:hypothetical protein